MSSATREVGWLIENNGMEIKPMWYWEDPHKTGWHSWTPQAHDAKRFPSKEAAEAFEPYRMIATDPNIKLTEHIFIDKSPAWPETREEFEKKFGTWL